MTSNEQRAREERSLIDHELRKRPNLIDLALEHLGDMGEITDSPQLVSALLRHLSEKNLIRSEPGGGYRLSVNGQQQLRASHNQEVRESVDAMISDRTRTKGAAGLDDALIALSEALLLLDGPARTSDTGATRKDQCQALLLTLGSYLAECGQVLDAHVAYLFGHPQHAPVLTRARPEQANQYIRRKLAYTLGNLMKNDNARGGHNVAAAWCMSEKL